MPLNIIMLTTSGIIDWNQLISMLLRIPGSTRHIDQTIDPNKTHYRSYHDLINRGYLPHMFARPAFVDMVKNWYSSNYNFKNITFENYYPALDQYLPNSHFSEFVVNKFESIIGLSVQECWISRVDPFTSVPIHRDEYDKEWVWINEENKKLYRYTVFIDRPIKKQIFIIGDNHYENIDQHTIVKWSNFKDYHALVNCSDSPNFLFHFLGFEK